MSRTDEDVWERPVVGDVVEDGEGTEWEILGPDDDWDDVWVVRYRVTGEVENEGLLYHEEWLAFAEGGRVVRRG